MVDRHTFTLRTVWTGAEQGPTLSYQDYSREYQIDVPGKPSFAGSADPAFLGNAALANPEDWLLAALSACHMLSYLAICARARLSVLAYRDDAEGQMETDQNGGRFVDALLRPHVVIADGGRLAKATEFHGLAHRQCFIANSVNFPVRHAPDIQVASAAG